MNVVLIRFFTKIGLLEFDVDKRNFLQHYPSSLFNTTLYKRSLISGFVNVFRKYLKKDIFPSQIFFIEIVAKSRCGKRMLRVVDEEDGKFLTPCVRDVTSVLAMTHLKYKKSVNGFVI